MAGTPNMTKRSLAWWLLAILALVAAACGDDSGSDDANDDDAAEHDASEDVDDGEHDTDANDDADEGDEVSVDDAMAAYEDCMDSHELDPATTAEAPSAAEMIEIGAAGAEVLPDDENLAAAHAECWPALQAAIPDAEPPADWPPADDETAQKVAGMVTCMNDKGYNFAETTPDKPYILSPAEGEDFDWDDPTVVQDRTDCEQQVGLNVSG